MTARSFAFRPRFRGLAFGSMGVGGGIAVLGALAGFAMMPLISGLLGVGFGIAYLAAPTWRITVTVDDVGLVVGSPSHERFRLAWTSIVRVVASPTTHTCFVDGGAPQHSLLVPGDGAPAPYDIADRKELFDFILAHTPADKVEIVESLEAAKAAAEAAKAAEDAAKPDAEASKPDAAKPDAPTS